MTSDDQRIFPTDVHHSLPMALLRAREAVMRHYRPMLDAHGVTEQQWRVLRVLAESEALDATEVATRANILAPSLTRMIRSMTERGLIERGSDDNDARRVMLRIGEPGRAVIRAASPESQRIYRQIEDHFGAGKMAQLVELLNTLSALTLDDPAGD